MKIEPEYLDFHHIRGGVSTHEVRVMKTVTVIGRLVDMNGEPIGGAQIVNHAGRTLSESDGLFTLELHQNNPVITVEKTSGKKCEIRLNPEKQNHSEMIFAGNLHCNDIASANIARGSPVT